MKSYLHILESAISDVGYWRWWANDLPESVQLQFGGAHLWSPPLAADKPPSGLVALRLIRPRVVAFLSGDKGGLAEAWFDAMHCDKLEPFTVDHEHFTVTAADHARSYLRAAPRRHFLVGSEMVTDRSADDAIIGFRAGPVGFFGSAQAIEVYNMQGQLTPELIEQANQKWWKYWREYWHRKDGPDPMPEDYACEVTIPARNE